LLLRLLQILQIEEEGNSRRFAAHNEYVGHLCATVSPSCDRFFLKNELASSFAQSFSQEALSFCPTLGSVDISLRFLGRFLSNVNGSLCSLFGNLLIFNGLRE